MTNPSVDLLITPQWPVQNIQAYTTTRGLQSSDSKLSFNSAQQKFSDFNLGLHVGDDAPHVIENRRRLSSFLPEKTRIQWLNQVHGSDVAYVTSYSEEPITADAAITQSKDIALSIMTADCLPILLANKDGSEVAAIHGGWRSLDAGIIANTINLMETSAESLYAWLGPCIGVNAFEVGEDVKNSFIAHDKRFIDAFSLKLDNSKAPKKVVDAKYWADLHRIAHLQLTEAGLHQVFTLNQCTYSNPKRYYSYRRDGQTGRMATVICRR